jgi:hypothetical protein
VAQPPDSGNGRLEVSLRYWTALFNRSESICFTTAFLALCELCTRARFASRARLALPSSVGSTLPLSIRRLSARFVL